MNRVCMNVHRNGQTTLVAACDEALLGKTFQQGKVKLEVKPVFYGGSVSNTERAVEEIDRADMANLVGENIITAAINRGLVDPQAVLYISGIPHVQIVKF